VRTRGRASLPMPTPIRLYTYTPIHLTLYPRLIRIQLIIPPRVGNQFLVGAAFLDVALLDHEDLVGLADGAEAMGYDECGSAFHERGQALLDEGFAFCVEIGSGLIEDEDAGICENGPGDGNALPLAA